MKHSRKGSLIVLPIALAVLIVLAIPVVLSLRAINTKRTELAKRYQENTALPSSLHYQHRRAEGDGVDSQPYWGYTYTTTASLAQTAQDVRASLQNANYTLGDVESGSASGIDSHTQYEFTATKQSAHVRLVVAVQKDSTVLVTVENN